MKTESKRERLLLQIAVPVILALLIGSSAPWWTSILFRKPEKCEAAVKTARDAFTNHNNYAARESALPNLVGDVTDNCGKDGISRIDGQIIEYIRTRCKGDGAPPPGVCEKLNKAVIDSQENALQ